jgi:hypothetical protein
LYDRVEESYYAYIEDLDSAIVRRQLIGFLPFDGELIVYYKRIQ